MALTKVVENCEQCDGLGKVRRGHEQVVCNLCQGKKVFEREPTLEERVQFLEQRVGGSSATWNLSRWH